MPISYNADLGPASLRRTLPVIFDCSAARGLEFVLSRRARGPLGKGREACLESKERYVPRP